MKLYVYLDESGSIHKNSKTKYFAVGGYFTFLEYKNKITSLYKKINKEIKLSKAVSLMTELKSYHLSEQEKMNIFHRMQEITNGTEPFYGCVKIFDKSLMRKDVIESNIFFNYAVKLMFKDCILPLIKNIEENIEFIIAIDNRNTRVGDLNNLEVYLKTEFCLENYDFKITYYDSASNYGIQFADLIVNTFYNSYKDKSIVKKVLPILKKNNFRVSIFPGCIVKGRTNKVKCNS